MARFIAIVLALLALACVPANASQLALVNASTKICQLTGDIDWQTNASTAARTQTNWGLQAVDLGFPVDSGNGPLYLLFGDAWPTIHPQGSIPSVPPDDAFGSTNRTAPPDPSTCLDLTIASNAPQTFANPVVTPAIKQGSFNVPSGGIFLDDYLYEFFWTNHCSLPGTLAPDAVTPLSIPAPSATCIEGPELNSVGKSVLARSTQATPLAFQQSPPWVPRTLVLPNQGMPSGFVYVTAAQLPTERFIPKFQDVKIPVFGVPRYRASVPYLAMAPRATFGNPATWSFYGGMSGGGPVWLTRAQWEAGHDASGNWTPPPNAEIYSPVLAAQRCVGEHSVTWNAPLHTWLLLYNCGGWSIEARTAPEPWGPWSAPMVLLGLPQDPNVVCTLIWNGMSSCPGLTNYWGAGMPGFFYAPFVMNRYTQATTAPNGAAAATIYWLLSTWNPYQVVVMKSTVTFAPNFIIRQPVYRQFYPVPSRPLPPSRLSQPGAPREDR